MSRKHCSVSEAAFNQLAVHMDEGESWSDLFERAAEALEAQDCGVNTEPETVAVENIQEVARATADEVEDRMTRR